MQNYKTEFIRFALSLNVLRFGEFTLKSGRVSPYFFNAGLFNTGADLARLGEFYATALQAQKLDYDVIFGPAYKGIPIGTAVSIALFNRFGVDKPVCFNRKEAKDHGERGKGELSAIQEVERDYQCEVLSIIDLDDLMDFIAQDDKYRLYLPVMQEYRQKYGV